MTEMNMNLIKASLCSLFLIFSSQVFSDEALDSTLETIESSIIQQNSKAMDKIFNFEKFLDRALEPLTGVSAKNKSDFRRGASTSSGLLSERMISSLANAVITRLKISQEKGNQKALYRFDLGEGGYAYLEFILRKTEQNNYEVIDWYSHVTSSFASESVRQVLVFAFPNEGMLDKFLNVVSGNQADIKKFTQAMIAFSKTRNPYPLIKTYEASGDTVKKNANISMIYLTLAGQTNDSAIYEKALKLFAKNHGNDPRFAFAMVDHYFTIGEYGKAVSALNSFERKIDVADPALYFLRANSYLLAQNYQKSIEQSQQALALDPGFEDAYWSEINAQVAIKNFKKSVELLSILENNFGYLFETEHFLEDDTFSPLVKSRVFIDWINAE